MIIIGIGANYSRNRAEHYLYRLEYNMANKLFEKCIAIIKSKNN